MTTERGYPWLKMYPTWLDDPKWLRLTDGAKARYIELYLLAGKADAGGVVLAGDEVAKSDDLAFVLRRGPEQVETQIAELVGSTLLKVENGCFIVTRFQEEQGPSMTDKRTAWRQRQDKKRGKYAPESKEEALNQEKEREEDKEEDKEEEVTRVSRVTVNPASSSFSDKDLETFVKEIWNIEVTSANQNKILETLHGWGNKETGIAGNLAERMRDCFTFRAEICRLAGGDVKDITEFLHLFPLPNLDIAMRDNDWHWPDKDKEGRRLAVLEEYACVDAGI